MEANRNDPALCFGGTMCMTSNTIKIPSWRKFPACEHNSHQHLPRRVQTSVSVSVENLTVIFRVYAFPWGSRTRRADNERGSIQASMRNRLCHGVPFNRALSMLLRLYGVGLGWSGRYAFSKATSLPSLALTTGFVPLFSSVTLRSVNEPKRFRSSTG